jgi:hypothetical protein
MLSRLLKTVAIVACLATIAPAQTPAKKPWTAPLAQDGHPDLEGNWVNKSATPLERPKELEGRPTLTDTEVAELKKRADRIFGGGRSDDALGDSFFTVVLANPERHTSASATEDSLIVDREFDNRTSLIIDPPDGKLPPYTTVGRQRRAGHAAQAMATNARSSPRDLSIEQRCLAFGVPRVGSIFGANPYAHSQIVQTPDHVVYFWETGHETRIIPLDGRPHLPPRVRTWEGDSRGRWEGKTLVVDTTNFSSQTNFLGAGEDLHLIERFTRVAPEEIRYEVTVDAPATWTKSWTAMVRLKRTEEKLYEFACHEGNAEIMETMLSGAGDKNK